MEQNHSPGYRPDIDGLRCIAISTVVLSHADVPGFSGGYVGVDVFFVISGFLITRILWAGLGDYPRSLITFYDRRARRILPALTVAVLATLAAGLAFLGPAQLKELAQSALATTFFVSNVWFWISSGDYFGPDVRIAPLLHTWSLAVEEQFYIVFPLLLALLARWSRRLVLPIIAVLCVVSLALSAGAIATGHREAAFYLLNSRAWELGIGALLALYRVPVPTGQRIAEVIALVAVAAILVPVALYDASTPFPGLAAVPPCLGTAALIWLHQERRTLVGAALCLPPLTFIGLISYSLYVWHWPIIVYDRLLYGDPTPARSLACILLSVALAGAKPAGHAADFLLWGDSHAGAVMPGVEAAAERAGTNGFLASQIGCPPLLNVDRLDLGTDHRCSNFNNAVLKFLQGRDDMPVVILAGRWALAVEGTRAGEQERAALLAPRGRDLPSGTVGDNFAVFQAGIEDTVAAIRATGRRVVVVAGVPEVGWPVPGRLGISLMHGPAAADAHSG